jgi:2-polyprenyl-6-methoxyphenol hydroxylase-like FAD-dependent oxidoreductase
MKALVVGGGIGGLTTAMMLAARGITCSVHEQAPRHRDLGVGITLMPTAVRELAGLGLLPALMASGVPSAHLYYQTRQGQTVWDEPRGLAAGHDVPQMFLHRGHLLSLLAEAATARLPQGTIHLGHRLTALHQTDSGVEARFALADGGEHVETADLLIGADGIHSPTRATLHRDEGPPRWSGLQMWRGAADWPAFRGGASLLILGGVEAKLVLYPIAPGSTPDHRLTNWVVIVRVAADGSPPPSRADWAREGRLADVIPHLGLFHCAEVDAPGLVAASGTIWEYAMFDRDPVAFWSNGCVTLLGDAAHPMYPMGANGATQAILDARALADALASAQDIPTALGHYQDARLPLTADIVRANRRGGPEAVIDAVERLAPDGFADVDAILSRAERQAILQGYAAKVGMAPAERAR